MNIYRVMWPQDGDGGVATAPSDWRPPRLSTEPLRAHWATPTFLLRGKAVDLQPNDVGVSIFSPAMRALMDSARADADRFEWLPVRVAPAGGGPVLEYAMLHFLEELDVVDRSRSVMNKATGGVVRAHLRADAIGGHRLFTYSIDTGHTVLFTQEVFDKISACTGCSFGRVKATYPEAQA